MAFEDFWMSEQAVPPAGASLRFSGSQQLTWTQPSMVGVNQTTWTQSMWVKRATFATNGTAADQYLMGCNYIPTENFYQLAFSGILGAAYNDTLFFGDYFKNSAWIWVTETAAVYRDPGAWMHVCVVYDSNNAAPADRQRVYINGVRNLSFGPYGNQAPVLGQTSWWTDTLGSSGLKYIGGTGTVGGGYLNGYLSDVFSVNGLALSPTEFGYFNANGVWVPYSFSAAKANVIAAGGFGTNGFALNFDSANFNSGTLVWADQSGNGNDYTANWNCLAGALAPSVSDGFFYGSGSDIVNDGPTVNMATMGLFSWPNPLMNQQNFGYGRTAFFQQGGANTANKWIPYTYLPPSGKFYAWIYWNWYNNFLGGRQGNGITLADYVVAQTTIASPSGNVGYTYNQTSTSLAVAVASGFFSAGTQVVSITGTQQAPMYGFFDMDNGKAWVMNNGDIGNGDPAAGTNPILTWPAGRGLYLSQTQYNTSGASFTGQGAQTSGGFNTDTTPANDYGFLPIQASDFPAVTVPNGQTGFQSILATDTTILTAAQTAFPSGLWWLKIRGPGPGDNQLVDSVRGAGQMLRSPGNANQSAFSFPGGAGNYVAWCWGVSAATGFDIVSYTGNGAASQTISHSLGAAPQFMIVKQYSGAGTNDYFVYHSASSASPQNDYYNLNLVSQAVTSSSAWNNTAPTSANFTVGNNAGVNLAGNSYIAYLWSAIPGYSAFGSYTGNANADGPFVYLGFAPALVIVKCSSSSGSWYMYGWDTNSQANVVDLYTAANTSIIEQTDGGSNQMDFLSNGFKLRASGGSGTQSSGTTYIYMAWAENPFGGSNVAPVTAR